VLDAERIHADDTTVPELTTKLKTVTGRIWSYVRDDQPFGGKDPPRQRSITRTVVPGSIRKAILPAMWASCRPMPLMDTTSSAILEVACCSHGRRKFVDLMKQGEAPIASEAGRLIDMLFEIGRSINGKTPEQRLAVRRERSRPLIAELKIRMHQQ
jgi:transposase